MNKKKAKENTEHESQNKWAGQKTQRFSFQKEAFRKTQYVKRENKRNRKITASKIAMFCPVMDVCNIAIPLI